MAELVVEDGTGLPDADSYLSLPDFKTFAEAQGFVLTDTMTDDYLRAALRRGTTAVDSIYRLRFTGVRLRGFEQALEWPRSGGTYRPGGSPVPDNAVPVQVRNAAAQLAWREAVTPGSTQPDYVATSQVVREKVDVLEVEYANATKAGYLNAPNQPVLTLVDGLLWPLLGGYVGGPYIAVV